MKTHSWGFSLATSRECTFKASSLQLSWALRGVWRSDPRVSRKLRLGERGLETAKIGWWTEVSTTSAQFADHKHALRDL